MSDKAVYSVKLQTIWQLAKLAVRQTHLQTHFVFKLKLYDQKLQEIQMNMNQSGTDEVFLSTNVDDVHIDNT